MFQFFISLISDLLQVSRDVLLEAFQAAHLPFDKNNMGLLLDQLDSENKGGVVYTGIDRGLGLGIQHLGCIVVITDHTYLKYRFSGYTMSLP